MTINVYYVYVVLYEQSQDASYTEYTDLIKMSTMFELMTEYKGDLQDSALKVGSNSSLQCIQSRGDVFLTF